MKRSVLILGILFLFSCNKKNADLHAPGTLQDDYANQYAGYSCLDLLKSDNFQSLGIEIDYMPGYKPDTTVITNTVNLLNTLCNKPGGILVKEVPIPASGSATLGINDIMSTEALNRTYYNNGSTLWLCITITDGAYTDPTVLGIAYRNTSICLFGKNVYDHSGGLGQVDRVTLESTVLEHEMGHLLGLVNMAPQLEPMVTNHLDQNHDHHCTNTNCLMYYQVETTDLLGFLLPGHIPELDSNCRADLHNNGGK